MKYLLIFLFLFSAHSFSEESLKKYSRYVGTKRERWTVLLKSSKDNTKLLLTYESKDKENLPTEMIEIKENTKFECKLYQGKLQSSADNDHFILEIDGKQFIFDCSNEIRASEWVKLINKK